MKHDFTEDRGLVTDCRYEQRPDGVHAEVTIAGEVDLANAQQVTAVVVRALEQHRPCRLHVNMAGVTFFGAAGVHALEEGRAAARLRGCAVQIEHACTAVSRVLALCGDLVYRDITR